MDSEVLTVHFVFNGMLLPMNPIASILDRYPVLVIDGALATELERRGYDL